MAQQNNHQNSSSQNSSSNNTSTSSNPMNSVQTAKPLTQQRQYGLEDTNGTKPSGK